MNTPSREIPVYNFLLYKNKYDKFNIVILFHSTGIDAAFDFNSSGACVQTKIISKFAALSGLSDTHDEFKIENKSILVHLKPAYLDFKDLYPTINSDNPVDFYGDRMYFNSYLVDFYDHECYKSIMYENDLRDEIAYENLKDFKKILGSLAELKCGPPHLQKAIMSINAKYIDLFNRTDFDSTNRFVYKKASKKPQKPRLNVKDMSETASF